MERRDSIELWAGVVYCGHPLWVRGSSSQTQCTNSNQSE
jgi:hypothetical protein